MTLVIEPGAIYLMNRGYVDFARLHRFTDDAAFFVTRTTRGIRFRRRVSRPVDFATGLLFDHTVGLATADARREYPQPLRRVRDEDPVTKKRLAFLTNNVVLPALAITQLYKSRWAVELFFQWITQPLWITAFSGTSENAVKTPIWIALSVYVLVAIVRKRLALDVSLYTLLHILRCAAQRTSGTLRAAIRHVEALPGEPHIIHRRAIWHGLAIEGRGRTSPRLVISTSTAISPSSATASGRGSAASSAPRRSERATIVDGNGKDRIYHAHAGGRSTLRNVVLRGGDPGDGDSGGAISNDGDLRVDNAAIRDNGAHHGGGLFNSARAEIPSH